MQFSFLVVGGKFGTCSAGYSNFIIVTIIKSSLDNRRATIRHAAAHRLYPVSAGPQDIDRVKNQRITEGLMP